MSYPPRHPMAMPGMPPLPPGMLPAGYGFPPMDLFLPLGPMMPMGMMPGSILPPGIPMPPMPDTRQMGHRGPVPQRKPMLPRRMMVNKDDNRRHAVSNGPTITVFVGNITERAADNLVKQILQKCGSVVGWKRVQGASGKLQGKANKNAFGFCEYGDPESALRAMRILHEWEIADKKLVVKVDAKTKSQLDEYKANRRKLRQEMDNAGGKTPTESERDDDEEIDEETKKEDSIIRTGIQVLLKEHEYDLTRPMMQSESRKRSSKTQDKNATEEEGGREAKDNLDEMDLEEDKKSLIHREIDKFRDKMKVIFCF